MPVTFKKFINACRGKGKQPILTVRQALAEIRDGTSTFDIDHHKPGHNTGVIDAIIWGNTAGLRDLLIAGANPDLIATTLTPLMIATSQGDRASVSILTKYGANPNVGGILHTAVREGHEKALDELIAKDDEDGPKTKRILANLEKICDGHTPLTLAAAKGNVRMISKLVVAGADPNNTTEAGDSALIVAVKAGKADAVEALVEAPKEAREAAGDSEEARTRFKLVDVKATDAEGKTALEIAQEITNDSAVIAFLGPLIAAADDKAMPADAAELATTTPTRMGSDSSATKILSPIKRQLQKTVPQDLAELDKGTDGDGAGAAAGAGTADGAKGARRELFDTPASKDEDEAAREAEEKLETALEAKQAAEAEEKRLADEQAAREAAEAKRLADEQAAREAAEAEEKRLADEQAAREAAEAKRLADEAAREAAAKKAADEAAREAAAPPPGPGAKEEAEDAADGLLSPHIAAHTRYAEHEPTASSGCCCFGGSKDEAKPLLGVAGDNSEVYGE